MQLWKIIAIIFLLNRLSIASEVTKMEEPTIVAGMSYEAVTAILHERKFEKLSEQSARSDKNDNQRTLRYAFKPRNDITPIHPSWRKSQLEFIFINNQLDKMNWYKKDGTALELNMHKIFLGPK